MEEGDLKMGMLENNRAKVEEAVFTDENELVVFASRLKRCTMVRMRRYDHPAAETMLKNIR